MKKAELKECFHVFRPEDPIPDVMQEGDIKEVGYSDNAEEVAILAVVGTGRNKKMGENPKCVCKTVSKGDNTTYLILVNRARNIYQPGESIPVGSRHADAEAALYGKPMWTFRSVSKACFNTYLKFLKTKNKALLLSCEQEIRHA